MQSPTCVSCRFFHADTAQAFGTCWHPDHQTTGVRITIRAQELNCYRGFGEHDWMPALIGEKFVAEDILISERPAPIRAPWRDLHPLDEPEAPAPGIRT